MIDDILTQDQRLVIVRSLNEYHGELNESVLQDCLDAYGHKVSRDRVRVLLAWLAEQDLLRLDTLPGGYLVAHLSGRGQAAWHENRHYPRRILTVLAPRYLTWGSASCVA